jgi:hypothetical protein
VDVDAHELEHGRRDGFVRYVSTYLAETFGDDELLYRSAIRRIFRLAAKLEHAKVNRMLWLSFGLLALAASSRFQPRPASCEIRFHSDQ